MAALTEVDFKTFDWELVGRHCTEFSTGAVYDALQRVRNDDLVPRGRPTAVCDLLIRGIPTTESIAIKLLSSASLRAG